MLTQPNFHFFRRGDKSPSRKLIILTAIYRAFPPYFRTGDVAPMVGQAGKDRNRQRQDPDQACRQQYPE